ncbi:hypothetical protein M5K25_026972 [Dendrobium thyrsiflorum]|uniref:Aminotransferase-like plant mobile domain-containing protein n=1 Tax=Dendrobium thyrsiflorum TaxID=117978 RepID=A0ABD0TYW8_DENTH
MFRWERPDDLPPSKPSEDDIWEVIDRQDLQGSADVQDRLEQHQDMLGRDTFHNFFTRSLLLPECSEDSVEFEDPDTVEPVGQSSLLSHRQLQSTPLEWPRDSSVGQIQSPVSGYVSWARYVFQVHRGTLQEAGIYKAVYASLFDYGRLPASMAHGLVEFWDAGRGSCWVGAEELTLTLSDLQTVSELPVFGHPFEECVPPDEQLFSRVPSGDGDRRGRLALLDVYPVLLEHYRRVYRASGLSARARVGMPVDVWIHSFVQHGYLTAVRASVYTRLALTYSVVLRCQRILLSLLLLLIALLQCYLALPRTCVWQGFWPLGFVPSCFRSEQAVLARLYRSLRTASEATSLELRDLTLPWHYLYGWIHMHILGPFSCLECPSYIAERGYPTVLQLSQASATLESERIRLFFFAPHLVANRFSLVYQPDNVSLPSHLRGTVVVDRVDHRGRRTLLQRTQSLLVAEYFISMRPEHGASRYERRVRELGLPRGHRSRWGPSETADGRGTGAEACITTGTVVPSPARASDVAPGPHHTEVSRSLRRRVGSQYTTSSRRSVDARPSPRDLVESPQEPTRSDFTGYSTPRPSDCFSFQVNPYGSFFPGETSWAAATSPTEFFGGPSHIQTTIDLVPMEFSFFPASYSADPAGPSSAPASYSVYSASPSTAIEGFNCSSEIRCYVPVPPNLRTTDSVSVGRVMHLATEVSFGYAGQSSASTVRGEGCQPQDDNRRHPRPLRPQCRGPEETPLELFWHGSGG